MIADAELAVQRNLTRTFIEADVLEIQLLRSPRTPDGAGGTTVGDPVPLSAQRMRLIPHDDQTKERLTADGKAVVPSYTIMGLYDADMQRWDEFQLGGNRYQIVFINQNRQYEVKGEVAYLG